MKIGIYCRLIADILTKVLQKCSLSVPLQNIPFFYNLLVSLVTMATKRQDLRKNLKNQLLRSCLGDKAEILQNCL